MRSEEAIRQVQGEILNNLVNTDDEKEKTYYQGQVRILSWVMSNEEEEVEVSESETEEEQEVK